MIGSTFATAVVFAFALLAMAYAAPAQAACPNEALREAQGSTYLPDCMALEMVSPERKFGQYAVSPGFSLSGDRIKFESVAALAETPKQGSVIDHYVATRDSGSWSPAPTALPAPIYIGYLPGVLPCSYSPDLARWNTWGSTASQAKANVTTAFSAGLGIPYFSLSPTLYPVGAFQGEPIPNGRCEGGTIDAGMELLAFAGLRFLPGDPIPADEIGGRNVFLAYRDEGTPTVELLARDKDGKVWGGRCQARVGASDAAVYRGSVSPDGSRIYFSTRPGQDPEVPGCDTTANRVRIMQRLDTPDGPVISQLFGSECDRVSPPCSTAKGDDVYMGASQEGDRVYVTTSRQLADSDLDASSDLYFWQGSKPAGERLAQASAGEDPTPGEGAEVLGVADFAGDGSRVYFVAKGVLTTEPNPEGQSPVAGQPNLYAFDADGGATAFIGTLLGTDADTWDRGQGGELGNAALATPLLGADSEDVSLGGDGHLLVFHSRAALTADDEDGAQADEYLYDSEADSLILVSRTPAGADEVPVQKSTTGGEAGYQALSFGRWASEDATTIVFTREEEDRDRAYLWREGEITELPEADQPALSRDGSQVAFVTYEPLLPQDGDTAKDVYVARVDGGFPLPAPDPVPCSGEACQGGGASPPAPPVFASAPPKAGNPTFKPPKRCAKGKRKVKRHGKVRCVRKGGRK